MPDRPHFSWPFQLAGNQIAVAEQDSDLEVATCIASILSWPLGTRPDKPTFGVQEIDFAQGGPDLPSILRAVQANEPRAQTTVGLDSLTDDLAAIVRVNFDRIA